jgi:hypothetical protein
MNSSKKALQNYKKAVYKKCVPERKRITMRKRQQEQQHLAPRTEPTISSWTMGERSTTLSHQKWHCFPWNSGSFRDIPGIAA